MIPLLKLPFVVAKEIFKTMSPDEIFFLTLLSKRMRRFIKISLPKSSMNLKILVGNYCIWATSGPDDRSRVVSINVNKKISGQPYKIGKETIKFDRNKLYWFSATGKISINLAKSFIEHLLDTFNNPIVFLHCMTSELDFPEYSPPVPLSNDSLTINGSCDWLKIENVMQCKEVTLRRRMPIERQIALFKKLIGTNCRLKSMRIPMNNVQEFPRIVEELAEQPFNDVWNRRKHYAEFEQTNGTKVRLQRKYGANCHVQKH